MSGWSFVVTRASRGRRRRTELMFQVAIRSVGDGVGMDGRLARLWFGVAEQLVEAFATEPLYRVVSQ